MSAAQPSPAESRAALWMRYLADLQDYAALPQPLPSSGTLVRVTGLVLEAAGVRIPEEHLVFQLLRDGELEELRQDETTDLRGGRAERFLIFPGAESFRIELDGQVLEWGACAISGARSPRAISASMASR